MQDIFERLLKINEADETYRNNVKLTVNFVPPTVGMSGLDDDEFAEAPDSVELEYDIEIEHRSWGIKDINVSLRGVLEFDVVVKSDLPDEEGKEITIPVKIDFSEIDTKINWIEGSGYAPAELFVTLDGEKVKEVEVDFYYVKP